MAVWHNGECLASPLCCRRAGTTAGGGDEEQRALCVQAAAAAIRQQASQTQRQLACYRSALTQLFKSLLITFLGSERRPRGRPVEDSKATPFLTCTLINVSICAFDLFVRSTMCHCLCVVFYTECSLTA